MTAKDDSLYPCICEKFFNRKKNRGCVKYVSIGNDYRFSINRDSVFFQENIRP